MIKQLIIQTDDIFFNLPCHKFETGLFKVNPNEVPFGSKVQLSQMLNQIYSKRYIFIP